MGLKSSLIALSCTRKIAYNDSIAKAGVKWGTSSVTMDCSCETKLTQHSRLALIMSFGFPAPVVLKVRFVIQMLFQDGITTFSQDKQGQSDICISHSFIRGIFAFCRRLWNISACHSLFLRHEVHRQSLR